MITSAIPPTFKQEVLDGIHDAADTYMMALFTSDAVLDAKTKSYSGQAGEVPNGNGNGYTKGGKELSGRKTGLAGNAAFLTFDDPHWSNASFTARGALIYNASKGNRAVAIMNFGQDHTCTNGSFVVTMPAAGAHAIIALG
jgi:hypothetical protein